MLANYLVLVNNRLADTRNYPMFPTVMLDTAAFFWRKDAVNYQRNLIQQLNPIDFTVELRKL